MNHAKRGEEALNKKDYVAAIDSFTAALKEHPTAPQYLISRSTAHQRAHQYDRALLDAERATTYAKQRARRELIGNAQLRRGIALFHLNRLLDASKCFEWSLKCDEKDKTLAIWISKCTARIQEARANGDLNTGSELDEFPVLNTKEETATNSESQIKVETIPTTPRDKTRHEWFQSSDTVTISVFAKSVPKDSLRVTIGPASLSVTFQSGDNASYVLDLDPLFAGIDVQASSWKLMATKIEISLKKEATGAKWKALEANSDTQETSSASAHPLQAKSVNKAPVTGPDYPTSSKTGPKNWDKIMQGYSGSRTQTHSNDSSTTEKEDGKTDTNYDSDEGDVDHFFKKLYAGASDDARRAMVKSYQESGGTALSTNWEDVKKKAVPIDPPEGMVAKKW